MLTANVSCGEPSSSLAAAAAAVAACYNSSFLMQQRRYTPIKPEMNKLTLSGRQIQFMSTSNPVHE